MIYGLSRENSSMKERNVGMLHENSLSSVEGCNNAGCAFLSSLTRPLAKFHAFFMALSVSMVISVPL